MRPHVYTRTGPTRLPSEISNDGLPVGSRLTTRPQTRTRSPFNPQGRRFEAPEVGAERQERRHLSGFTGTRSGARISMSPELVMAPVSQTSSPSSNSLGPPSPGG